MSINELMKAAAETEESISTEFREFLKRTREKQQNIINEFQDKQRRTVEKQQIAEQEYMERKIDESIERVKKSMREEDERERSLVGLDAETERAYRGTLQNALNNRSGFKK